MFNQQVVWVTGGSSGIGEAAARRFAAQGAKVAILGYAEDEVHAVAQDIERRGGQVLPIVADVSDPQAMSDAVDQIINQWGRLDIVFANAGINGVWAPIDEIQPDEWDKTLATNLKGTYLTVHFAVPHMRANGGSIVITSSVNGTRIFSNTGATAYSCSKAAQVAFTKMMALELAKYRIRVNVVCPGAIQTQIEDSTEKRNLEREKEPVEFPEGEIPLTDGEAPEADTVADLVLFLSSKNARHISGTEVWIDGAQSLLQG